MNEPRAWRSRRWWPVTLLALFAVGGCAMLPAQGPNFRDETANWGEMNRPVKVGGGLHGVTSEAQQIERNLGIR
jgi:hypothetical protein